MKTGKKFKAETEEVKRLLKDISADNVIELNDLIYAGAKLISD